MKDRDAMLTMSLEATTGEAAVVDAGEDWSRDYQSLVMEACEVLGATDCRFHMGGFGTDD